MLQEKEKERKAMLEAEQKIIRAGASRERERAGSREKEIRTGAPREGERSRIRTRKIEI